MDVRRIFSGLNVIALGLILLGNTLGYLPWSVWWNILSLWPLLLVAAGLDILGRAFEWQVVRALSGLVILGGLAYGALVMPASGAMFPAFWSLGVGAEVPFEQSVPRPQGTSLAVLRVSEGASDVTMGAIDDGLLVSMSGRSVQPVPRLTSSRPRNGTYVDISRPSGSGPTIGGSTLRVGMDRTTDWGVTLETGASNVQADLSELAVRSLTIQAGAASVVAKIGAKTDSQVGVSAGASSISLSVPDDANVTVVSDSGLTGTDLPGFQRTTGIGFGHTEWVRAGSASGVKIAITANMGVGSLRVDTYKPGPSQRPSTGAIGIF